MENKRELTDADREEILRLILSEAAGADVTRDLNRYPVEARNTFRRVVQEAGLVRSGGSRTTPEGEILFEKPLALTPIGRKRLAELNERRGFTNGRAV